MTPRRQPAHTPRADREWILWASELSPFALKVDLLCDFAGLPHRWLPAQGSFFAALAAQHRVRRLAAGKLSLTWPEKSDLDELPLVPYLFGPAGENLYDSSAIAVWLDRSGRLRRPGASALLPEEDRAVRFAIRLVDEFLDEFGLYMAHHNRWKVSARDNDAGARLAAEQRPLLGPFAGRLGRWFAARQVRRLPYLFSVSPSTPDLDDLPEKLRPPSRSGFPPTHALLEERFAALLSILEELLRRRPFIFGSRFTLADASVYGQLAMNCSDPSAEAWIRRDAPGVRSWLKRLAGADFTAHDPDGAVGLDEAVRPLLAEACRVFVPLMQQNHDAWRRHRDAGQTVFNERAFDRGLALYDGALAGHPFRAVAKTFQVRVWLALRSELDSLPASDRRRLEAVLPAGHGLDRTGT